MIKRFLLSLLFTINCLLAMAQGEVEMADALRANGKIYVVVGVISIIFIGIIVYLISIDRKVKKLEDSISKK